MPNPRTGFLIVPARFGEGQESTEFRCASSLRTSLMTFTPRSVRTLPMRRPTADPAPVSSMTTPVRASGGGESCAARITVRSLGAALMRLGDRVRE
jgi:hypothetical protein